MAQIVFGAGTSHTPYLLASDETLKRFEETDSINKHRDKEGRQVTYGELLEKADPKLASMVAPEHLVARQNVARAAVKKLRDTVANAKLDALIVLGDDQNESYKDDCHPAFAIYFGDTILNDNKQHNTYSHLPEWYIKNRAAFFEPEKPRLYPVHSRLALHLIENLMDNSFDITASKCLPGEEGEGHAIAYIHRHAMDSANPVPVVPVFLNTYYPPNQPRPARCYELGQAIRKAVEKFPGAAGDDDARTQRHRVVVPDRYMFAMHQAIEPVGQARNDFDILADLAGRLGFREDFTEGRTEMEWLRHLYDIVRQQAAPPRHRAPGLRDVLARRLSRRSGAAAPTTLWPASAPTRTRASSAPRRAGSRSSPSASPRSAMTIARPSGLDRARRVARLAEGERASACI